MFPKVGVTVVRLAQVNQELENAELEEEVLGSEKLSAKTAQETMAALVGQLGRNLCFERTNAVYVSNLKDVHLQKLSMP